jgi:fructokinase
MNDDARRPLIVGLGEILWDLLPAGKQLGGAPANFAYHAAALGARGAVVSRVGDDALGRDVLERLDGLGLDRSAVSVDREHSTGTVEVRLDAHGVPTYVIREHVAWDFLPASPPALAVCESAAAVCYGTLASRAPVSARSIGELLGATAAGCLRVFDVNLRQSYFGEAVIRRLLALSDVVKLNDAELPVVAELLRLDGPDPARRLLERHGLRAVAVTRGGAGSRLYTPGGVSDHPGVAGAAVADTVGAGDAFTAALVLGLLDGHAPDRINAFANRLAAHVCSQPGATPPIPRAMRAARAAEAGRA